MSNISRRTLLASGLWLGGSVAASLCLPRPRALAAAAASNEPAVFSNDEWTTVEAVTARLIPTDHEPGAREAGCVNFIDKALANEDAALVPVYRAGLRGLNAAAGVIGEARFIALEASRQDKVLAALEDGDTPAWPVEDVTPQAFFTQIWMHTIWGFLAAPEHGGNRDYAGWRVLGYPGGRHMSGGYTAAMMAGKEQVVSVWGEKLPRKQL